MVEEPAAAAGSDAAERLAGPEDRRTTAAGGLTVAAWALCLASLVGLIGASGIWDPYELRVAELSRRIAVALLGGAELAIEGADNTVPNLGDLARGQLPFTSVALGFRLFGLHDWAGRLPLALWGVSGALATWWLLRKLVDARAAAFAVLVLATTPLYFVQSRTMLGEVVTMASFAIALAGLTVAIHSPTSSPLARSLALLIGLGGLLAGFGARGCLIGVAMPALPVGVSWLIHRGRLPRDRYADAAASAVMAVALLALVLGGRALLRNFAEPEVFSMLVGVAIEHQTKLPTFDFVVQHLGHGLFPWSALLPVALGRLLWGDGDARENALRTVVIVTLSGAFVTYGLLAPVTEHLAFAAVPACAIAVAVAMRDFERGAKASRSAAMVVVSLAILLYLDFKNFPEKAFAAFAVEGASFPESYLERSSGLVKWGTVGFIAAFFGATVEHSDQSSVRFNREEYLAWPRTLGSLNGGSALFFVLVLEAALFVLFALQVVSDRFFHWDYFEALAPIARAFVGWGWLIVGAALLSPLLVLLARDVFRSALFSPVPAAVSPPDARHLRPRESLLGRGRLSRATCAVAAGAACGALLSFVYYPALAAQVSPKGVFQSYRRLAKDGEPLAMVGVAAGTASYHAGRTVPTFEAASTGFTWLTATNGRRWLVVRATDLPQLNALYRARVHPPRNLPVLDSRSSEILLVSNQLTPEERNENPLDSIVSSSPPKPARPLAVTLGNNQLDVLGWEVRTLGGRPTAIIEPGKPYDFVIYYRVRSAIAANWETFIHIEGYQRRHNADHPTLQGRYPLNLWRAGDYITDVHTFALEPNFSPGQYSAFFGLFIGSRRLEVKRGSHDEDRIRAGVLEVR